MTPSRLSAVAVAAALVLGAAPAVTVTAPVPVSVPTQSASSGHPELAESPLRPVPVDRDGTDADAVLVPDLTGVHYVLATAPDQPLDPGEHLVAAHAGAGDDAEYSVSVAALPAPGYELPGEPVVWELTFTRGLVAETPPVAEILPVPEESADVEVPADTDEPAETVEPAETTVIDLPPVETSDVDGEPAYLLPARDGGFTWVVNGTSAAELVQLGLVRYVPATEGGTGPAGGHYRVTASVLGTAQVVIGALADPGHLLAVPDGAPQAVRYVIDPRQGVELELPTVVDGDGTADSWTVPAVEGLVYVDAQGEVLQPGEYEVTGYQDYLATVELSLTSAPGYRLETDGAPLETLPGEDVTWPVSLVFDSLVTVLAQEPIFADVPGTTSDTYTVPEVAGVSYVVDGTPVEAGTYPALGTVEVTAHPTEGHRLAEGLASWQHTFSAAEDGDTTAREKPLAPEPVPETDAAELLENLVRVPDAAERPVEEVLATEPPAEATAPADVEEALPVAGSDAMELLPLVALVLLVGAVMMVRGTRDSGL